MDWNFFAYFRRTAVCYAVYSHSITNYNLSKARVYATETSKRNANNSKFGTNARYNTHFRGITRVRGLRIQNFLGCSNVTPHSTLIMHHNLRLPQSPVMPLFGWTPS
jgi:hypothetical protein